MQSRSIAEKPKGQAEMRNKIKKKQKIIAPTRATTYTSA